MRDAVKAYVRAKLASKLFYEEATERILLQDWNVPPADPELAKDKNNWGGTRIAVDLDTFAAMFGDALAAKLGATANGKTLTQKVALITPDLLEGADEVQETDPATGAPLTNPDGSPKMVRRSYLPYFQEWKAEGLIM